MMTVLTFRVLTRGFEGLFLDLAHGRRRQFVGGLRRRLRARRWQVVGRTREGHGRRRRIDGGHGTGQTAFHVLTATPKKFQIVTILPYCHGGSRGCDNLSNT